MLGRLIRDFAGVAAYLIAGLVRAAICCAVTWGIAVAQNLELPLSNLDVGSHDPLYTTYAAPMARSEYFIDAAYYLDLTHTPGFAYVNQASGSLSLNWAPGDVWANFEEAKRFAGIQRYAKPPMIRRSYTDFVETEYWPFAEIEVRERFLVYSSRFAVIEVEITNHSRSSQKVTCLVQSARQGPEDRSLADEGRSVFNSRWVLDVRGYHVDPKTWSETEHREFDPNWRELRLLSLPAEELGNYALPWGALRDWTPKAPSGQIETMSGAYSTPLVLMLPAGHKRKLRVIFGVQPTHEPVGGLLATAKRLLSAPLEPRIAASEQQYAHAPRACRTAQMRQCVRFPNRDWELAYWSALTQVRQQMMPPEGAAHFNYYLFSREPTWSWGHDGQVFHESIVMQAYALMNPESAQDSQRVFMERQLHVSDPKQNGYIGYRVGPYVNRTFPTDGELTSSAPFFSWTNWEIYGISHDRQFLGEAYRAGTAFANWIFATHDPDHDGVLVWGGNAMLENVRDSLDVIWNLLGGGDESPKRVKALDLMCMMVKETRSLAAMAGELGLKADEQRWNAKADQLADVVRTRMWDAETGFFYNLARDTGGFTTADGISLKRQEIIGFLPLWAGIATREQAERLRQRVADPASFARRFGLPTLAADDPYFDPRITRCCQWNGAVWLLWDYLVERGLLDYHFRTEAEQLVQHAMDGVLFHLRTDHRLWESYSPDRTEINSPPNYIWDGIIARMIWEVYGVK